MPACLKCGTNKRKPYDNNYCTKECYNEAQLAASASRMSCDELLQSKDFIDSKHYWENMNKLLDVKFNNFEQSFKNSILGEVRQITDPIAKEVKELKDENKKLKTEVTILKAKEKEHGEKLEKVEIILKEHQSTLSRNDKDARSRRLILAGVPETEVTINDITLENDKDKVEEVMKILDPEEENIRPVNVRRIGKKDQGAEARSRYLLLGFANTSDRNKVKKNSDKLKEREDTKNFYLKADLTKQQRDEYKRLYDTKKRIEDDDPDKDVKIEYGKLYVDNIVVDHVADDKKHFL